MIALAGIGMSQLGLDTLKTVSDQGRDIIDGLLSKVIIPALPFYIAGVLALKYRLYLL